MNSGQLVGAALCFYTLAAPAQPQPKLPSREKALIAEAYNLWAALAEQVWPGTVSLSAPFVYVGEQHEFAIGFPRTLEGFKGSGENVLGRSVQIRERTLAADLSASTSLQGVSAVFMGSPEVLQRNIGTWVIVACHEMFHVFQAANNAPEKIAEAAIGPKEDSSWQLNFPFPYRDADTMRLMHLQGYLIWAAAQSSSPDEAKYNVGTALDAVSVYRSYLAKLTGDEKAYRYAQFQEWSEGVAAYFEYKIAEKAALSTYRPTDEYAALTMFKPYETVWRESYETWPFLTKHAGRAAKNRTGFYHLGGGKALALDKIDPTWKKKYFLRGVWMDDLLAAANQ